MTITSKRIATLQNPDVSYVHLICLKESKSNGSRIKNPNNPARLPLRESIVVICATTWRNRDGHQSSKYFLAGRSLAEDGQRHSVDFLLFLLLNKPRWRRNEVSTPVHHIESSRLYSLSSSHKI